MTSHLNVTERNHVLCILSRAKRKQSLLEHDHSCVLLLFFQLLGKDYGDIDMAVDNMRGTEFSKKVKDYSSLLGTSKQSLFFQGRCLER